MIIKIDKNDYLKEVVQKTIFTFKTNLDLSLMIDERYYIIESKDESMDFELFYKELEFNDLRFHVSKQTDTIKKLIIGRALYDTCIMTD